MSHVQEIILRNKVDRRDALPSLDVKVIKREMETQRESPAVMEQHSQTGILKGVDGVSQTPPAGLLCVFKAATQTGILKGVDRSSQTPQAGLVGAFEAATQTGSMKGVDGCSQTNQVLVLCEMSDGQCVKKDSKKQPPFKTKRRLSTLSKPASDIFEVCLYSRFSDLRFIICFHHYRDHVKYNKAQRKGQ